MKVPILVKILFVFACNVALLGGGFYWLFRAQFQGTTNELFKTLAGPKIQVLAEQVGAQLRESDPGDWGQVLANLERETGLDAGLFEGMGRRSIGTVDALPEELISQMRRVLPLPSTEDRPKGAPPGPKERPRRFDEDMVRGTPGFPKGGKGKADRPPPPGFGDEWDQLAGGGWPFTPFSEETMGWPMAEFFPPDGDPKARRRDPGEHPRPLVSAEGVYAKFAFRGGDPAAYWVVVRIPVREVMGGFAPALLAIRSSSVTGGGWFLDPNPWLMVGFGAVALSVALWTPLAFSLTHSLRRVQGATARIATGDFDVRLPDAKRHDEMGALAASVNQLAGRLEGFVSGQRRFMGDIAHELCSPIARMQAAIGILERDAEPGSRSDKYLNRLGGQLDEMSRLVNELLSFSKSALGEQKVERSVIALAPLLEEEIDKERGEAEVLLSMPGELWVRVEPGLLARAVGNLIRNAVRYASEGGTIEVRAERKGNRVRVQVVDSGPGVPEDEIHRLFDAFYRPDASRSRDTGGVGLGLAIVKSCAAACAGTVSARNRSLGGLEVTLDLEAADERPENPA